MQEDFKGFRKGCRYLVKDESKVWNIDLIEINILEISEKAIKIKYENGNTKWYLKESFNFSIIENLSDAKTIEDRSHEIQFDENMWCEKDEPQFTLKMTEENDIEVKLKVEEKPKLEWQQNPPEKLMTWYEAMGYADSLDDVWRLPTKEELKEAYDNKAEGFQSALYWSSSTYAQTTDGAWGVYFGNGYAVNGGKTNELYVRCVREVK